MALKYVCDSCGMIMEHPNDVKMKEFYVGTRYDIGTWWPVNTTQKYTVHLCDDCFKNLKYLADKKKGEK